MCFNYNQIKEKKESIKILGRYWETQSIQNLKIILANYMFLTSYC